MHHGKTSNSTSRKRGMRFQSRDLEIFTTLGLTGILDTTTIHVRWWPGKTLEACRSRLRQYAEHGLIQSIELELARTSHQGRLPQLHRLTEKAADILEQMTGVRPQRTARSDIPTPYTLMHRVGIAKTVIAFQDAAKNERLETPEWVLEYDTYSTVAPKSKFPQRYRLCFSVTESSSSVTCWPDGACLLQIESEGQVWRLLLLLEFDNDTETQTQLFEKLDGYQLLLSSKQYEELWPHINGVRVLFVMPSMTRLVNAMESFHDHPVAGAIRLAVFSDLTASSALKQPIWWKTDRTKRAILGSSTL